MIILCTLTYSLSKGKDKKVNVLVDERMELLCTIELIGNNMHVPCANTDYKREIKTRFQPYKTHPAVSFIGAMLNSEEMGSSALVWYIYQCSFPEFRLEGKIIDEECQIGHYEHFHDTLTKFRTLLKDFYNKSRFHDFFLKHKNLYDSICTPITNYINHISIVDTMEKHYNQVKKAYYLVLSPLVHPGGFGVQVHRKNGDYIYGIAGPIFESKTKPIFPEEDIFQNIIIHEFSHSFCNWIIHRNFKILSADSCLVDTLTAVNEHMRLYYGGDWETSLFEHLTRANEIVICKKVLGQDKANITFMRYYNHDHWIYLKGLVPLIENVYLRNKQKYNNEEDLIPDIVEYLNEEKVKYCR